MSLPLQPPPDAPAPPPGPEALRSQRRLRLILWGGAGCMFTLLLMFFVAPLVLKSKVVSQRAVALNNARQIGISLFEFDAEYGSFPSAATIPDVKAATSTSLTLDDSSSNKLFRQLIAYGLKSERPFFADIPGTRRPDDIFSSDATAISKGECGFSYITGLNSSGNPKLPVVMTPMEPGTQSFYQLKQFRKEAIILRLDNSASPASIEKNGAVVVGGGLTLFDPKLWGSVKPDLRWPE
ncbi:hypothetical protein [Luteolibacter luteus]|uniref:Uncharacterized protein n=1 Tax=Luteolibacter luteus TaxID=2728835 RepID=A0A858RGD9_9BACT|nr:hypothetical protein [Luteolibacter luteus]QJE95775.1 hypothetical protein HHL09_08240 [Luteolibacter luteus]